MKNAYLITVPRHKSRQSKTLKAPMSLRSENCPTGPSPPIAGLVGELLFELSGVV
jgi:hypothetical protein